MPRSTARDAPGGARVGAPGSWHAGDDSIVPVDTRTPMRGSAVGAPYGGSGADDAPCALPPAIEQPLLGAPTPLFGAAWPLPRAALATGRELNSTSKFVGVHRTSKRRKPWAAACYFRGKQHHLGYFETEREAARAYDLFVVNNRLSRHVNLAREMAPGEDGAMRARFAGRTFADGCATSARQAATCECAQYGAPGPTARDGCFDVGRACAPQQYMRPVPSPLQLHAAQAPPWHSGPMLPPAHPPTGGHEGHAWGMLPYAALSPGACVSAQHAVPHYAHYAHPPQNALLMHQQQPVTPPGTCVAVFDAPLRGFAVDAPPAPPHGALIHARYAPAPPSVCAGAASLAWPSASYAPPGGLCPPSAPPGGACAYAPARHTVSAQRGVPDTPPGWLAIAPPATLHAPWVGSPRGCASAAFALSGQVQTHVHQRPHLHLHQQVHPYPRPQPQPQAGYWAFVPGCPSLVSPHSHGCIACDERAPVGVDLAGPAEPTGSAIVAGIEPGNGFAPHGHDESAPQPRGACDGASAGGEGAPGGCILSHADRDARDSVEALFGLSQSIEQPWQWPPTGCPQARGGGDRGGDGDGEPECLPANGCH